MKCNKEIQMEDMEQIINTNKKKKKLVIMHNGNSNFVMITEVNINVDKK